MGILAVAAVLDDVRDLSASQKLVLCALARHADDTTLECYPRVERLAEEAGLSVRQVQRVLRLLESKGYVTLGPRTRYWHANAYKLSVPSMGRTTPQECDVPASTAPSPQESPSPRGGGDTAMSPPGDIWMSPHNTSSENHTTYQPAIPVYAPVPYDVAVSERHAVHADKGEFPHTGVPLVDVWLYLCKRKLRADEYRVLAEVGTRGEFNVEQFADTLVWWKRTHLAEPKHVAYLVEATRKYAKGQAARSIKQDTPVPVFDW